MLRIGKTQTLKISHLSSIGAHLEHPDSKSKDDAILLPNNQLPANAKAGDQLDVFIYRDSKGRLIATLKKPYAQAGEIAYLKVVQVTGIGAFLDWGLEKDLLLPFSEQKHECEVGKSYIVAIYLDKSDRLAATMYIEKFLHLKGPYKPGDKVKGIIYKIDKELGALVAVDNKYKGLIHKNEYYKFLKTGETVEMRVLKVREDGKLDLSTRERGLQQINNDAKTLLNLLEKNKGFLPYNDDSDPEEIKKKLQMSKAAFKRALGYLLKQQIVIQTKKGIENKKF